jgi:hypothetical protein
MNPGTLASGSRLAHDTSREQGPLALPFRRRCGRPFAFAAGDVMETTRRGFFGAVAAALIATRILPTVAAKAAPAAAPLPGYGGTAGGGKSMALTFRGAPVIFNEDAPATRFYYVRRG